MNEVAVCCTKEGGTEVPVGIVQFENGPREESGGWAQGFPDQRKRVISSARCSTKWLSMSRSDCWARASRRTG